MRRILGLDGSPDGIGQSYPTEKTRGPGAGLEHLPLYTVAKKALGQDEALSLAGTIFRMVLMGAAGTVTGMAMAPSHDKRTKYAITGGLLGFFLGPLGIGGQAVYVLSKE